MGAATLIDTHVLIWLAGSGGPGSPAHDVLTREDTRIVVSSVCAFEIALKVHLGKLDTARDLVAQWPSTLARLGAQPLAVTAEHGLAAGSLDWDHRDPFDRLLVAQAQVEDLTLVTADRAMLSAPGVDLLRW
jgi:PIN domain nuclease of toxin-antitoxin system